MTLNLVHIISDDVGHLEGLSDELFLSQTVCSIDGCMTKRLVAPSRSHETQYSLLDAIIETLKGDILVAHCP